MTAMLIYAFKIIRAIIFSSVKKKKKNSTVKQIFYSKGIFLQSWKLSKAKRISHSQKNF